MITWHIFGTLGISWNSHTLFMDIIILFHFGASLFLLSTWHILHHWVCFIWFERLWTTMDILLTFLEHGDYYFSLHTMAIIIFYYRMDILSPTWRTRGHRESVGTCFHTLLGDMLLSWSLGFIDHVLTLLPWFEGGLHTPRAILSYVAVVHSLSLA